jgi:Domain of unknown function (DUF4189)
MPAVRSFAISTVVAITTFLIAAAPLRCVAASEASQDNSKSFVVAQTSLGAPDPSPPPFNPGPDKSAPSPRLDYIPTVYAPNQPAPSTSTDLPWGAIGFTADGSYSTTWKMASQPEAEAKVAKKCAEFGRGGCQVVSFSGQECVALATFIGSYRRRRWNLSFTAGGETYPEAQNAAIARCNSDERSAGRCQPRTAACADGR